MRTLFPLAAVIALAGPAPAQPAADSPAAPRPAVPDGPAWYACRVVLDPGDGPVSAGSGTPVYSAGGKTLVLTCAHVVPADHQGGRITVEVGGRVHPAKVVDGSAVRFGPDGRMEVGGPDLCLLEVAAELGAVPVAGAIGSGEVVFQAGYGGGRAGDPPATRRGQVSAVRSELALSYPVEPGDSGAGVFNGAGELVGVTVGRDPATRLGSAVPVAAVRAFLGRPGSRGAAPGLAARLGEAGGSAAGHTSPAEEPAPAGGDGLPPTLTIDGKTYTRVPGTRQYVADGAGSSGTPEPSSPPR